MAGKLSRRAHGDPPDDAGSSPLLAGDALAASSLAVSIRDLDGAFLSVNAPFAALVGLSVEELRGSNARAVFPSDIAEAVRLHDGLALSSPGVVSLEEWVVDRVGRRRVATSRFAVRDRAGTACAVCCVSSAAGHERLVRLECERLFELDGGVVATTDPDAAAALAAAEAQRHELEARLGDVETARAELLEEVVAAEAARADAQERLNAVEQRLAEATAAHAARTDLERRATEAEEQLAAAEAARVDALAAAEHSHVELEQRVAAADAARADVEHRLAASDASRAAGEDRLAEAMRQLAAARERVAAAEATREAAAAERDDVTDERNEAVQAAALAAKAEAKAGAEAPPSWRPEPAPDATVRVLRTLGQTLAAAEDFDLALRDAVGPLGHGLGWDAAFVWRRERPDGPLTCVAAWADPNLDLARFETASWQSAIARGSGPLDDAFADSAPTWIADTRERQDCARLRDALAAGLCSSAVVPIVGPEGVDGVLEVLAHHSRPPDPTRLDALSTAGAMLGDLGHLLARVSQPRWSAGRR